jgi:hypothetical protein
MWTTFEVIENLATDLRSNHKKSPEKTLKPALRPYNPTGQPSRQNLTAAS